MQSVLQRSAAGSAAVPAGNPCCGSECLLGTACWQLAQACSRPESHHHSCPTGLLQSRVATAWPAANLSSA